jgi:hypothetical protein
MKAAFHRALAINPHVGWAGSLVNRQEADLIK